MSSIVVTSPLGVSAKSEVDPPVISATRGSRYIVTLTIERGTEAVAGVHRSKAQRRKVEFDGRPQLSCRFPLTRPARKPRTLAVEQCDLSTCGTSHEPQDDEHVVITLDVERPNGKPDGETVGLREPGFLPLVLRNDPP